MNNRNTILLGLAAVVMAAGVWYASRIPGTGEREEMAKKVLPFKAGQVDRIEITNGNATVVLVKQDGQWALEKPLAFPADADRVGDFLADLEYARRVSTVAMESGEKGEAQRKTYGLAEPRAALRVREGSRTWRLDLGVETVRKGRFYAAAGRNGRDEVVVVERALDENLNRPADHWRERRVFPVNTDDISELLLRQGGAEVQARKDNGEWKLERPLAGPVDPQEMRSFLSYLVSLRAERFVSDDEGQTGALGLDAPELQMELQTGETRRVLRLGKAEAGDKTEKGNQTAQEEGAQILARLAVRPTVFTLPAKAREELGAMLDKVRDKRPLPLASAADITAVRVEADGRSFSLQRNATESAWQWHFDGPEGPPAEGTRVSEFLDKWIAARAVQLAPWDEAARAKAGLDKPAAVFEFTVQNRTDVFRVELGRMEGQNRLARSTHLDALLTLGGDPLLWLPASPVEWHSLAVTVAGSSEVRRLEWTRGKDRFAALRGEDGQWKEEGGAREVDTVFLGRQLDLLARADAGSRFVVREADFAKPDWSLAVESAAGGAVLDFLAAGQDQEVRVRKRGDAAGWTLKSEEARMLGVFPYKSGPPPPEGKTN
jgi:hypothetical protein